MDNFAHILLLIFSIIIICFCQNNQLPLTEPKLISVTPINSTALIVQWKFADSSIDQSDLIKIYIIFYEYYYNYNKIYASTNYTFISTNKTITILIKNFELVNAYYYVCFSSNSTITNVTIGLVILNQCILTRTCSRSNTLCSGPSFVIINTTSISSNSFIISFFWPIDLPYTPISFFAQLLNNGQIGTALSLTQSTLYTIRSYQFTGLQSKTIYTVNTSFSYTFNNIVTTNTSVLTVTTSVSWKLISPSVFLLFSIIISFFF